MLDSYFMSQRMPGMRAYILICVLFSLPVSIIMLIAIPLPAGLGLAPLASVFVSTIASSLAIALVLQAMKSEHVSRISPLISTSPVFVAFLAVVFLDEGLAWQQWLAIAAVVTGAVLISFKTDASGSARFHLRPFVMLMTASVLVAVSNVTNKYALGYMSYWNSATLIFLISSVLFLFVCVRRSVLRELASLRQRNFTIGVALANQAVAMVATVLAFWAVELGPVALVSTVFNSKPLFIFAFAALAGRFVPRFLPQEPASRRVMFMRAGATLLVVGGLVVMLI